MKKAFVGVSVLSLVSAIAAWFAWACNLLPDSGLRGEHWDQWQRAIDLAWRIIPWGIALSVIFSALSAAWRPRTKPAVIFALCITTLAFAFGLLVVYSFPAIG